jgi:hypothetical protein
LAKNSAHHAKTKHIDVQHYNKVFLKNVDAVKNVAVIDEVS